jgi:hypothetical protein
MLTENWLNVALIEASKHLLCTKPQLGQVTQSVEAKDLLAHSMVFNEALAVAI